MELDSRMVAAVKENKTSANTRRVMDDQQGVDFLLKTLAGPGLGERIAEAARLAVEEHQRKSAQQMRSAVEAENSTK